MTSLFTLYKRFFMEKSKPMVNKYSKARAVAAVFRAIKKMPHQPVFPKLKYGR
jgi:hypothetical protein